MFTDVVSHCTLARRKIAIEGESGLKRWLWAVWLAALVGCTSHTGNTEIRDTLANELVEARQSQQDALAFWDRIIFGEVVSCQEGITVPGTVKLAGRDTRAAQVVDQLNAAIQDIRNSSDLWNIECESERPYVPLEMAREGRADALAADEPLSDAAALLADWEDG